MARRRVVIPIALALALLGSASGAGEVASGQAPRPTATPTADTPGGTANIAPWLALLGVVIGGAIGGAVSLGTLLLTQRFTRQAEERRAAQESKTRFHQDRRRVYALLASKARKVGLEERVSDADEDAGATPQDPPQTAPLVPGISVYDEFNDAYFEARMLSSARVGEAAAGLRRAVDRLRSIRGRREEVLTAMRQYRAAMREFEDAARRELDVQ